MSEVSDAVEYAWDTVAFNQLEIVTGKISLDPRSVCKGKKDDVTPHGPLPVAIARKSRNHSRVVGHGQFLIFTEKSQVVH